MLCYNGLPKIPKEKKKQNRGAQNYIHKSTNYTVRHFLAVMYEPPAEDWGDSCSKGLQQP